MAEIVIEQALFRREHEQPLELSARSPGFADDWRAGAERLIAGFGERSGGVTCLLAVFAQPLGLQHVAVVRAADQQAGPSGWPALAFQVLVCTRADYEKYLSDPFAVAQRAAVDWSSRGELPALVWPAEPLPARTVSQVQAVLKRVKAGALREDEDPEVERTVENSESPALLGGTQVLVDGGKLVFIRKGPDQALVEGLWTLLPYSLRGKIWPASFAFTNDLGFDIAVVPRPPPAPPSQGGAGGGSWEGYTTEEQAASYPAGSYELALQTAAEAGDQAELNAVFARRTSNETLRLAWHILIAMAILVIGGQLFLSGPAPPTFPRERRAALAAGVVAVGDPWTAWGMLEFGNQLVNRAKEAK